MRGFFKDQNNPVFLHEFRSKKLTGHRYGRFRHRRRFWRLESKLLQSHLSVLDHNVIFLRVLSPSLAQAAPTCGGAEERLEIILLPTGCEAEATRRTIISKTG